MLFTPNMQTLKCITEFVGVSLHNFASAGHRCTAQSLAQSLGPGCGTPLASAEPGPDATPVCQTRRSCIGWAWPGVGPPTQTRPNSRRVRLALVFGFSSSSAAVSRRPRRRPGTMRDGPRDRGGPDASGPPPFRGPAYKTKLCALWKGRDGCPRPNCGFAHGQAELRRPPPRPSFQPRPRLGIYTDPIPPSPPSFIFVAPISIHAFSCSI
jgi:hypothetical protein